MTNTLCLNPFEVREVLQERWGGKREPTWVSIPLKPGRCCKIKNILPGKPFESQSLWSQGGAASTTALMTSALQSLNPFEVREVLQDHHWEHIHFTTVSIPLKSGRCCKRSITMIQSITNVSIPLKSGRCCKILRWLDKIITSVSIPLKSGRCCKHKSYLSPVYALVSIPLKSGRCCKKYLAKRNTQTKSQSLWSQGGAASFSSKS